MVSGEPKVRWVLRDINGTDLREYGTERPFRSPHDAPTGARVIPIDQNGQQLPQDKWGLPMERTR